MDYENHQVPEGINVSATNPLLDFLWMVAAVGGIVAAIVAALSFSAGYLVKQVPFEHEQRLARAVGLLEQADDHLTNAEIRNWLQSLADDLSVAQGLPEGMRVSVHYIEDDDIVNAYATLGGHVVIYSGLLQELHSENGLAMVLAHEIAHIKHRDPIVALGRGAAVMFSLSALGGVGESGVAQNVIGNVGMLTALSFNRSQESDADTEAVATLIDHYGHLSGAEELFSFFAETEASFVPEMVQTHPLSETRLAYIQQQMHKHGGGELTPLPEWVGASRQHESTQDLPANGYGL